MRPCSAERHRVSQSSWRRWRLRTSIVAAAFVFVLCLCVVLAGWLLAHRNASSTQIDPHKGGKEIASVSQNEVWRLSDDELGQLMFQAEARGDANAAYRVWHHLRLFGGDFAGKDHDVDKWLRWAAQLGHEDAKLALEQETTAESEGTGPGPEIQARDQPRQ